jgi:hypothetical protein
MIRKPSEIKKQFADSCKTKTIIAVRYGDVEKLINAVFKNENHKSCFELPCTEERGSGDGYDWEINIRQEPQDDDVLEKVKAGKWPMYCTGDLLTICCNRGLIPAGNYLIDISW